MHAPTQQVAARPAGRRLLVALAACGSDKKESSTTPRPPPPAARSASHDGRRRPDDRRRRSAASLAGVCPATVVIQTDWNPEAEHGHLYQMLGAGYTVDKKSVTGPLIDPRATTPASSSRSAPAVRPSASRR